MNPSQSNLPLFSLKGKNILIIGSSRGLGENLSLYLNENNVNVIGVSRSKSKGDFKQLVCDISEISNALKIADYLSESNIFIRRIHNRTFF